MLCTPYEANAFSEADWPLTGGGLLGEQKG